MPLLFADKIAYGAFMQRVSSIITTGLLLVSFLVLAACQDPAARAQEHYERALSLLAEGDTSRAEVEFRNTLQHDGTHRDARAAYAQMLRDIGRDRQAIRQFRRLVEQYPTHVEGLIAVTELTLMTRNFETARRYGERAMELAPDDPRVAIITIYMHYLDALEADDALATEAVGAEVETGLEANPDNVLLQRLALDVSLRGQDFNRALALLDSLMEAGPADRDLYDIRLAILVELNRADDVEELLREMIEMFPGDEELPATVLRFYLARGDAQEAASFLRQSAEEAETPEVRTEALTALVQLLLQIEGPDAALAELEAILAADDSAYATFAAQRAAIRFEQGEQDAAIAELDAILARDDLANVQKGQLQVVLANMLLATGNEVGARALVEQVLEADPTQTDALRMQASWLISEDEADEAISALRTVLDLRPDDAQAMTLMAQAHSRNGNHELAREFLGLAVEASGSAPAETIRYVDALMESERFLVAEELLITALRRSPENMGILNSMGQLYIAMEDWPRAEQVETRLRELGGPERTALASTLQVARLAAQGQVETALETLETLAASDGTSNARVQIAVVQARLGAGDREGALSYAEELVSENPDDVGFRFTLAAVRIAIGDYAGAEALYREVIEERPTEPQVWIGLMRVLNLQGRSDEAREVLDSALDVLPEALDLLWAQASSLEQLGDYEGAIAVYEEMYARAPNAAVVANNLASLLSTYRSDEVSLERAWTIARRLRGNDFPPFQDTYGWLAYQRGEYEEAVEYLEPAARGLPDDPLVQYHLGRAYLALGRQQEALEQLRRAVTLAGPEDPRAQFAAAREEITQLEATLAE